VILAEMMLPALAKQVKEESLTLEAPESLSLGQMINVPVSVASKSEQNLASSPGTVRVITRQQISNTSRTHLSLIIPEPV
jgi:hypothetical protein